MIASTLDEADRERLIFVPVRDYYDTARWAAAVRREVGRACGADANIALIAYAKDASSYYLNHFPQWEMVPVEAAGDIHATTIRREYFGLADPAASLGAAAASVPVAVQQFLTTWATSPDFAALAEEHRFIQKYKAAWAKAPYAVIFSTVDAVVACAGHDCCIVAGLMPEVG